MAGPADSEVRASSRRRNAVRANTLILGLALASTTMLVALDLGISAQTERTKLVLIPSDDVVPDAPPPAIELEAASRSLAQEPTRVPAPTIDSVEERLAAEGAVCSFDVTFVTVDAVGRPLPWTSVELALDGFRFNRIGTSDMKGCLNAKWTGTRARFDGVVRCAGTIGSRLRLRSGTAVNMTLRADGTVGETYDPAQNAAERMNVGQKLPRHGLRFAATPSFHVDARGRGEFVDVDLIARIPTTEGDRRGFGGGCGGCRSSRVRKVHIEGLVHDEHGTPLRGIEYRVFKNDGTPLKGETSWEGKLVIDTTASGGVDVWIGGRDRALVCRTFDARETSTPWDIELARVPLASGVLVDEQGKRLLDWTVEARDVEGSFVGATITNGAGEFEIGVADGEPVELRARPFANAPACIVAKRFVPCRAQRTVVAVARIATLSWWIELPFSVEGDAPEARLEKRDTGESIVVALSEIEERGDGPAGFRFCSDKLLAGDYVVSSFAPGCVPASQRGVLAVLAEQDFGKFELAKARAVELPDADLGIAGELWVTAVTTVHGVRVRSQPMAIPNTFAMTDGDYDLEYRKLPSNGSPESTRRLRVGDGPRKDF
jgi:hypothetical protein